MFKFNPDKTLKLIKKAQQGMPQQGMPQQGMPQQQMPQQQMPRQQMPQQQEAMPLGTLGEDTKIGNKATTSKDQLFERLLIEKEKVSKLKNYLARQGVDTSHIIPEEGLQPQASLQKRAIGPLAALPAIGKGALSLGSAALTAMTLRDAVKGVANIPGMIKGTVKGMQAKYNPFLRPQIERQKVQRSFRKSPWGIVRGSRNLGLGRQNLNVNKGQGWMS